MTSAIKRRLEKEADFLEELEKKLKLAADSCSFAVFQDKLGKLLEEDAELSEDLLEKAAGGVKTDRKGKE